MYTQCPDCEVAFKVTADVLKQAAGQVRCGGCGNAFNALAYLSEQIPKQPAAKTANETVPELTPEIIDTDDGLPQSISAEQSAALLKTLDELAGSDIRIEDTGVEWRVLDEDEAAAPAADDDDAGPDVSTPVKNVDEYLDDAETPIDEFLTATPEVVDAPEVFAEEANGPHKTPVVELRFDDNTPLPDDFDLGDDSSYVAAPESTPDDEAAVHEITDEEPQPDLALSEPDEWTDILDEFQDLVDEVAAPIDSIVEDAVDASPVDAGDGSVPLDMDTQFALQAEAMGIDLSGINEMDADDEESEVEESEVEPVDDDAEIADDLSPLGLLVEPDGLDEQHELLEEPIVETHTIEDELAGDGSAAEPVSDEEDSSTHYVPPMTEEEHTVNMQIDQDLMALAIEDKDGFASTIIIPDKGAEKVVGDNETASQDDSDPDDHNGHSDKEAPEQSDDAELFETIIMEGDHVRTPTDSKKLAVDAAAAAKLADAARARDAEQMQNAAGMRYGMIGGVVVLVLLLAIQTIHQSREALATIPAFNNTVGQVYRAIGRPVQPAWDITGWRFEATKGSTEGESEELTIYSRLGNNSDSPLPYPLIGISLTDRFEETIGSRVLDPVEYLPTDLDPRKLVEPGNTFNAVITIKSTSENATGFKLNVCYRLSNGRLRCAIDDFK